MSEHTSGNETTSGPAIGTVRPWQTLASLGVTEDDLTTVHHGLPSVHRFRSARHGERRHHLPAQG